MITRRYRVKAHANSVLNFEFDMNLSILRGFSDFTAFPLIFSTLFEKVTRFTVKATCSCATV